MAIQDVLNKLRLIVSRPLCRLQDRETISQAADEIERLTDLHTRMTKVSERHEQSLEAEIERLNLSLAEAKFAEGVVCPYCSHCGNNMMHKIERLKTLFEPFAKVVEGVPDNWPGECRLRIDTRDDGSEYLAYHGDPEEHLGVLPTLDQWRKAAKLATE